LRATADPSDLSDVVRKSPRPFHPYVILAAAILLPGFGYVLLGQTRRGFTMQMFMIVFAFVTWHLAPAEATLIGKLAGGIFLYALTIPESYRTARLRWLLWQKTHRS
jgi:hypothetical protein